MTLSGRSQRAPDLGQLQGEPLRNQGRNLFFIALTSRVPNAHVSVTPAARLKTSRASDAGV